jgi:hypothetical protein
LIILKTEERLLTDWADGDGSERILYTATATVAVVVVLDLL